MSSDTSRRFSWKWICLIVAAAIASAALAASALASPTASVKMHRQPHRAVRDQLLGRRGAGRQRDRRLAGGHRQDNGRAERER